MAKTKSLCDFLKVLRLAEFSEILSRYTTQNKLTDHELKITFQHLGFVRKPYITRAVLGGRMYFGAHLEGCVFSMRLQ